ncbi:MAG: hypothetical protein KGI06_04530 [Candidatus Micrarchaeota archaeon]|nr:hypothetical protein [Candidatus Micrarchaeota archaeon]
MASENKAYIPPFAFIGKMASGKGTYVRQMRESIRAEFGVDAKVYVFSTKIIEIARDLFGMEDRDRKLMSSIGNKMREIDASVWAKYIVRKIKSSGSGQFIIDGIRAREEAEALRASFPDMLIVRIEADEGKRMEVYKKEYGRYPTEGELNDLSETGIGRLPYDMEVFNNYERKGMEAQVEHIIRIVGEGNVDSLKGLRLGFS